METVAAKDSLPLLYDKPAELQKLQLLTPFIHLFRVGIQPLALEALSGLD